MKRAEGLKAGDRVRLGGGYSFEPEWLSGLDFVDGRVAEFIPGQNENLAAVIKLDSSISAEGVTGDTLVLELRYVGATWEPTGIVHVELCDFPPEPRAWKERRQGRWVESHATYQWLTTLLERQLSTQSRHSRLGRAHRIETLADCRNKLAKRHPEPTPG